MSDYAKIMESEGYKRNLAARFFAWIWDLARRVFGKKPVKKPYVRFISFGPQEIEAGKTEDIQAFPQGWFKGEQLISTGDLEDLYINGLFVGNQPQVPMINSNISVKSFLPTQLGNKLLLDTCQPEQGITLRVRNMGTSKKTFSMTIRGKAADC